MILQSIAEFLFGLVALIIDVLPIPVLLNISTSGIMDIIGFGMWLITPGVFLLIAGNILFWSVAHFNWSLIKLVWSFIRG